MKDNISAKGIYEFTLRNVKTGAIKKYHTHNAIVSDGFYYINNTYGYSDSTGGIEGIACGSGTGTPSNTDTALFSLLWKCPLTDETYSNEWDGENTKKIVITTKIPASKDYTGTITEVGYYHKNDGHYLVTHALVQDAEGNAISIEKTDIDELTVRTEFVFTRDSGKFGCCYNLNDGPFGNALYWLRSYRRSYRPFGAGELRTTKSTNPDLSAGTVESQSGWFSRSENVYTFNSVRYPATNSPSYFINTIFKSLACSDRDDEYLHMFFGVRFPNSDIFAQRTLTGLALGTGDGATVEFTPVLPAWVKDTEKVYKNGVELTRGVDYTCDNIGNPQKDRGMTAGNFIDRIVSGWYGYGSYAIPGYCSAGRDNVYATEDAPIIIRYFTDPLIGNDVNTIIVGSWSGLKSGAVVTYSISEDGTDYTDVYSFTATGENYGDTTPHTLDKTYSMKYMKISVTGIDGKAYQSSQNSIFMHLGSGVTFAEAPAEGDVLTMDADIDRPWKSTDYILDFAPQFKLI